MYKKLANFHQTTRC